jgi:hypothetical protein
MMCMSSIRVVLGLASFNKIFICINLMFLNGDLEEEIYMQQPKVGIAKKIEFWFVYSCINLYIS